MEAWRLYYSVPNFLRLLEIIGTGKLPAEAQHMPFLHTWFYAQKEVKNERQYAIFQTIMRKAIESEAFPMVCAGEYVRCFATVASPRHRQPATACKPRHAGWRPKPSPTP